ncbi:hypothetical protein KAU11_01955 [Candidatus Babeliales bacterium]|nr:hypothetical protein [Candidatus Babeliales bacterium]
MKKLCFLTIGLFFAVMPKLAFLAENTPKPEKWPQIYIDHTGQDYSKIVFAAKFDSSEEKKSFFKSFFEFFKERSEQEKAAKLLKRADDLDQKNKKNKKRLRLVEKALEKRQGVLKDEIDAKNDIVFLRKLAKAMVYCEPKVIKRYGNNMNGPLGYLKDWNFVLNTIPGFSSFRLKFNYRLCCEKNIEELAWEYHWDDTRQAVKWWLSELNASKFASVRRRVKTLLEDGGTANPVTKKFLQNLWDKEFKNKWNFSPLVPANLCGYSAAIVGIATFIAAYRRAKNNKLFFKRSKKKNSHFKMALKHLFLFPEAFCLKESKAAMFTWLLCGAWIAGKLPPLNKTFWNRVVELG